MAQLSCNECGKWIDSGAFCKEHKPAPLTNAPERIRTWVNAKFVENVTQDLIDVATGNRLGNRFEQDAIARIFQEWSR